MSTLDSVTPALAAPPATSSAWPRVYRVRTLWRILGIPGGIVLILFGIELFATGFFIPPGGNAIGRIGAEIVSISGGLAIAGIGFGLAVGLARSRIVLMPERIAVRSLFRHRAIERTAIAARGRRRRWLYRGALVLRPRDPAAGRVIIPRGLRTDAAFDAWLAGIPDEGTFVTPAENVAEPVWPRVYRLSWSWRLGLIPFGATMALVGFLLVQTELEWLRKGMAARPMTVATVLELSLSLLFAILMAFLVVPFWRLRLVLTSDTLDMRGLFGRRAVTKSAIAGVHLLLIRRGQGNLWLRLADPTADPVLVSLMLRRDPAFTAWFASLPFDTRAVLREARASARRAAIDACAADPRYGASPEARRARLRMLRGVGLGLTAIAFVLALWCLVAPRPNDAWPLGLAMALPWIALLTAWASRGLIRFIGPWRYTRPSLLAVLPTMALTLGVRALADDARHVLGWGQAGLVTVLGGAILVAAMALADAAGATLRRGAVTGLALAPFALVYAFGAGLIANRALDRVPPQVDRVAVLERDVVQQGTKLEGWKLRLAPGGPWRRGATVAVPFDLFNRTPIGSRVCVRQHPGRLGIPWVAVAPCLPRA